MIKRIAAAAAVVAALLVAKHWWDQRRFGVAGAAPLGEFRRLDPYLTGDESLRKSEGTPDGFDVRQVTGAARAYTYTDAEHSTPSGPERIIVLLRADGSIAAVGAQTNPGPGVTRVTRIMLAEWERIFGG